MESAELKNTLEALLLANDVPMSVNDFVKLFDGDSQAPERDDIKQALTALQQDYEGRGIELVEVASGFRVQVRQEYAEHVNRIFDEKPARYSRALLETLAIIAYRQPITRSEIEEVRGVSVSSNIVKTLQERGWVRIVGHRDVPGKPGLLATTKEFLDYFNLKKLSELPSLAEIKDFDQMNPDLFEGMDMDELRAAIEPPAPENPVSEDDSEAASEDITEDIVDVDDASAEAEEETEVDNVIPFTG